MKKIDRTTLLILSLILAVTLDIALRLELLPPPKNATEFGRTTTVTVPLLESPASPAFSEYREYPLEHGRMRFNHVALIVADLERSVEFYTRQLGFREVHRMQAKGSSWHLAFLTTGSGETILELQQHVDSTDESARAGISHIGLFVSDVNSFYENSLANGANWEGSLLNIPVGQVGFMIDPDGYRVEVMENPLGNCVRCHKEPHLQ